MNLSFNSYKWARRLAVVFLMWLIMGGFVQFAYADPHAVFYTATGQQQLFFNVLAALDQADYVEPAKSTTGTPSGASRKEILEKREKAGFGPEQNSVLNATKTDLAGVLTRGITLEGNDLWSSYLAHQFALEATRRRNTDELVRIYCERGLGLENCENSNKDVAKKIEKQGQAYVRDPKEVAANSTLRGAFSALLSGLPGQQEDARKTLEGRVGDDEPSLPLAYDPSIADWWKAAQRTNAVTAAASAVLTTAATYFPIPVNAAIWDYVTFDEDGEASLKSHSSLVSEGILPSSFSTTALAQDSSGSDPLDPDTLEGHEALVAMALQNSAGLRSSAEAAAGRYEVQTDKTTVDGAIPDVSLSESSGVAADIGEIDLIVKTPAHAKVATVKSAVETVANAEQNTQSAAVDSEHIPGTQETVNRGGGGNVKGVATGPSHETNAETTASAGSILGLISQDPSKSPEYHKPQPSLPFDANVTAFHHEQGAAHLLQAIGQGSDKGGCGCSAQTATNHFGAYIIRHINNF